MTEKRISIVLLAIAFFCINGTWALSQNTLRVGRVIANPGEKKSGFIEIPAGIDGPELQIPHF